MMYIPKAFREDDLSKLHELIHAHSFATLITIHDGAPLASHLPFLLDTDRGPYGTLWGHMARANWQWHDFEEGHEALVIFQGPHTYISPSWYEEPLSVPTWNFAAVHAYGIPRVIEDPDAFLTMLKALTARHEAQFEQPWPFDLPDDFVRTKMRGTVGFEMEITRLEGKFKLSQNRPASDQDRVMTELKARGEGGVASLMEQSRRDEYL